MNEFKVPTYADHLNESQEDYERLTQIVFDTLLHCGMSRDDYSISVKSGGYYKALEVSFGGSKIIEKCGLKRLQQSLKKLSYVKKIQITYGMFYITYEN